MVQTCRCLCNKSRSDRAESGQKRQMKTKKMEHIFVYYKVGGLYSNLGLESWWPEGSAPAPFNFNNLQVMVRR